MEKLFYYTGMIAWIVVAIIASVYVLAIIWKVFKTTIVWKWIDVQLATLRYITFKDKNECTKYAMEVFESRLKFLKEQGIRKFEQRFLEKLIKISVVKPSETIFG